MNKEKIILFVLAAIQFTHIMDFMIMMPLSPIFIKTFNIIPKQFGYLVSSYNISAGIMGVIAAFFIDRFDRKKILIFIYLGFIIGTLTCAFAATYELLLMARILTGAFGGILSSLILSIIGDVIPAERRGVGMGVVMAGFSLAAVVGVPFGNFAAVAWSWHAPFFIIAIAGVLVFAAILAFIPALNSHLSLRNPEQKAFSVITNIIADSNQLKALSLTMLLMIGQFSIIPYIAAYMRFNVGFEQSQITYIYLLGGLVSVVSSPIIGKLADRHGKAKVFTVSAILSAIPIFLITHMGHIHLALALTVTTFFFIITGGRIIPAMAMITSSVSLKNRGSFMSINSATQQFSSGLAAFIAGLLVIQSPGGQIGHYSYVGYLAIASTLLCILIARQLKPVQEDIKVK